MQPSPVPSRASPSKPLESQEPTLPALVQPALVGLLGCASARYRLTDKGAIFPLIGLPARRAP